MGLFSRLMILSVNGDKNRSWSRRV